MYPKILADLTHLDYLKKDSVTLAKERVLLRFRRQMDSTIIQGLRSEKGQLTRRTEVLQDSSSRGWQMADYWQKRYRRANRERWGFRFLLGWKVYDAIKK